MQINLTFWQFHNNKMGLCIVLLHSGVFWLSLSAVLEIKGVGSIMLAVLDFFFSFFFLLINASNNS